MASSFISKEYCGVGLRKVKLLMPLSFSLSFHLISNMASSLAHQSFPERMIDYLSDKGWPKEYMPEELNEKFLLLDWIAFNLLASRPFRTRQLFIYGGPETQKTLFFFSMSLAKS